MCIRDRVELLMGNVQRLFYFHVGAAWVGAMVFGVALVCGALYLWRGRRVFDTVSLASVEVGLVFLSMAIVGGSFWGKPAWNTWWLWSPRLTLVTVAWLVYAAYFMPVSYTHLDVYKRQLLLDMACVALYFDAQLG